MEITKWIVNDNSGHGCEDISIFDTMDEANAFALDRWKSLHEKEKELSVITVHYVTESMLEDGAAKKGDLMWYYYKDLAETPECFDSRIYKKTEE